MLTPDEINALRDAAYQITGPITEYLIRDIAQRIAEAGQLTSTAQYQIWREQRLGLSQREVERELRRLLKMSKKRIRKILHQSAQSGYSLDINRFPTSAAIPFEKNAVLQQIVSAAVELAEEDFTNLTQTLGMVDPHGRALPLQDAYRACTDFAFKQAATGAVSYTEAIRQATRHLAAKGVRVIDYESGVHTSLEAAVRRNILGGLGLMQEQISQTVHDQLGCDGWEITAHANSAPDHEPIQGRQYPDEAYQALNASLVRRIGTLNCGHAAFPVILGVNQPQYSPRELEAFREDNRKGVTVEGRHYTGYEATQMQRKLERAIRAQKRRVMVDEATGDKEKLRQDKTRLTVLHQRYREFSKAANLRTQYERTEVAGFGEKPKTAFKGAGGGGPAAPGDPVQIGTVDFADKKAVLDQLGLAQKETAGLDYEVNYSVTSDGKVWRVSGKSSTVNPSAIPSSLAGSYSYHNHPAAETNFSFSAVDVKFFFQSGEAYAKASDYLYEYVMRKTSETLAVDPDMVYHMFGEIEKTSVFAMKWDGLIDPDLDGYHEVMKILSRELKFEYERKKIGQ